MQKLLIAINAFMDNPVINAARHSSKAANALAEQIEREMTMLGLYSETDDFLAAAASALGKKGGSATSEAKAEAARANGRKNTASGRPQKPDAKPDSVKRRERRAEQRPRGRRKHASATKRFRQP